MQLAPEGSALAPKAPEGSALEKKAAKCSRELNRCIVNIRNYIHTKQDIPEINELIKALNTEFDKESDVAQHVTPEILRYLDIKSICKLYICSNSSFNDDSVNEELNKRYASILNFLNENKHKYIMPTSYISHENFSQLKTIQKIIGIKDIEHEKEVYFFRNRLIR